MKFYLEAFINSFYNIDWLSKQRNDGKRAAAYFLLFMLVFSIVTSAFFTQNLLRNGNMLLEDFVGEVPSATLTIDDGKFYVEDLAQPYEKTYSIEDDGDVYLYIDTVTTSTADLQNSVIDMTVSDGPTTILVTQDFFTVYDARDANIETQYFSELTEAGTHSITTEEIKDGAAHILAQWHIIFLVILIFIFVAFTIGKLIHLVIIATMAYIFSNIKKFHNWNFKQLFTLSIFTIALPMIVNALMWYTPYDIPFLSTIISIVFVALAMIRYEKNAAPAEKEKKKKDEKK